MLKGKENKQKNPNTCVGDFSSHPVVKNLPCNVRDMSSIPGRGTDTPHSVEQLSLHATATEPSLWSPHVATAEPAHHSWSLCTATKILHVAT